MPWNLPEPTSWLGNLSTEESIHVAHRATSPSPRAWPGTVVPSLGASADCPLPFQIGPSETSQQATLTSTLRSPKALRADIQFIPQTFEHSLNRCGESWRSPGSGDARKDAAPSRGSLCPGDWGDARDPWAGQRAGEEDPWGVHVSGWEEFYSLKSQKWNLTRRAKAEFKEGVNLRHVRGSE